MTAIFYLAGVMIGTDRLERCASMHENGSHTGHRGPNDWRTSEPEFIRCKNLL